MNMFPSGTGLGAGAGTGTSTGFDTGSTGDQDKTSITNFIPPVSQCFSTPQMYHFFPGVVSVITSYPLVKDSLEAGTTHPLKPFPSTLNTLCFPTVYLNTTPKKHHYSLVLIYKTHICIYSPKMYLYLIV
ncbi:hypothetical protein Hanom_Chr04g00309241 [Helianthus anomalus]